MAINFPNTPSNGDTHAVGDVTFTYNAAKNSWLILPVSSGGSSVVVSDTPPSNPNAGDMWTDSETMKLNVYYVDADSAQWVEVSGSATSSGSSSGSGVTMETTDPLITNNGTLGELWLNTTSGELYACTDITTDDNIWTNIGDGTGNITSNVPPENPTNTTIANRSHDSSFNHTFTGGTDTDGNVTHYIVDEITGTASGNVVSNPMTVALPEVPVGVPHQFTIPTLTDETTISFRVRSKDNSGSYSSGVTITFLSFVVIVASGGIIDTYTVDGVNYKSHTFLTSGTFVTTGGIADVLTIAGGGGGGGPISGGGGAGGMVVSTNVTLPSGSLTVTVGGGGTGGYNTNIGSVTTGTNGSNSSINTISSTGGGTSQNYEGTGIDGGSGGGSPRDGWNNGTITPGSGVSGQGNDGGVGSATGGGDGYGSGGGGGGAGSVGGDAASGVGGDGGDGLSNLYRTGVNVTYAAGGGGGTYNGTGGTGGSSIGGDGSNGGSNTQTSGSTNTGSGGGGGGYSSYRTGGNGGSGIVIVRYPI